MSARVRYPFKSYKNLIKNCIKTKVNLFLELKTDRSVGYNHIKKL